MDGIQGKNAMEIITVLYQTFTQPAMLIRPVAVVAAFVLKYTEKNVLIVFNFTVKPIYHQGHAVVVIGLVQL